MKCPTCHGKGTITAYGVTVPCTNVGCPHRPYYVVQNANGYCLDCTAPDEWTSDPRKALASQDRGFIQRHAARREGCTCLTRKEAIKVAKTKGIVR